MVLKLMLRFLLRIFNSGRAYSIFNCVKKIFSVLISQISDFRCFETVCTTKTLNIRTAPKTQIRVFASWHRIPPTRVCSRERRTRRLRIIFRKIFLSRLILRRIMRDFRSPLFAPALRQRYNALFSFRTDFGIFVSSIFRCRFSITLMNGSGGLWA